MGGIAQYDPKTQGANAQKATFQTKPTLLLGGGADYLLDRRFGVRLQFRELMHPAASLEVEGLRSNTWVFVAEPMIGTTVRF